MNSNKKLKIGISGLNNNENPAPGVGVAKSLKPFKHELIGLSYDENEAGIYQELFDKVYLMPYPTLGIEELINRLKYIKKTNGLDIIIPNLDAELPLYIKYKKEIENIGIKILLPSMKQFELRDKTKLAMLAQKLGILVPDNYIINNIEELIKYARYITYPFYIKGKYYKAYKVHSIEEAMDYFYSISNEWGLPIILQNKITGIEVNYIGIADGKELLGGVGIKKLTTTSLGKVWNAMTIKNKQLEELAKKFVEVTGWKGPFEIEAITTGENIFLIEINPRFPAWVNFATEVGVNLPNILVKLLIHKDKKIYKKLNYKENKMYIRYVEETIVDFTKFSEVLINKEITNNIKDKNEQK